MQVDRRLWESRVENDYAKGRLGVASPPPLCTPHWARLENKVLTSHWECVK